MLGVHWHVYYETENVDSLCSKRVTNLNQKEIFYYEIMVHYASIFQNFYQSQIPQSSFVLSNSAVLIFLHIRTVGFGRCKRVLWYKIIWNGLNIAQRCDGRTKFWFQYLLILEQIDAWSDHEVQQYSYEPYYKSRVSTSKVRLVELGTCKEIWIHQDWHLLK